jgi:uncharacterized MAPEG superfamily protein
LKKGEFNVDGPQISRSYRHSHGLALDSLCGRAGKNQRTAAAREDPCPRGKGANRTYVNAVETFCPFAALVIVAHLAGKAM